MAIFHLGAIFDASEGKGLTFFATFPWLECLIVLWLSFFFYPCLIIIICHLLPDPLPPLCHLLSSFGLPLHTPWLDDVIYEQPLNKDIFLYLLNGHIVSMDIWPLSLQPFHAKQEYPLRLLDSRIASKYIWFLYVTAFSSLARLLFEGDFS